MPDYTVITELPASQVAPIQIERAYSRYRFAVDYSSGKNVLEVACGGGQGLGLIAKKAKKIIGGDFELKNLAFARQTYQNREGSIEIVQLDAHNLPFEDNFFDLVLIYEAIYYLKDPEQFLEEASRVLAPDGTLIICTANKNWPDFNPSPFSYRYFSIPELNTLLNDHGFHCKFYGAFPDVQHGIKDKVKSLIKKMAVKLKLIPKTMKGKILLKKLFFGELQPMPAEFTEGITPYTPPVPLPSDKPDTLHTALYAVASKLPFDKATQKMVSKEVLGTTQQLAWKIRCHALKMTSRGGSSHIASILSMADIMAVLYGAILHVDPQNPKWAGRDRFLLSKGHAGAGVYASLAERGFFPIEKLMTHYQDGSDLSGHVSHKGVPGVELSTGSLGMALSVATGMALSAKLNKENHRVFCVMSDGECDEGSVWESILFAPHHKLDNLVVIVDYNKIQSLTSTTETLELEPFSDKWKAFGWHVTEVDGHNHEELIKELKSDTKINQPKVILAHTIKGKGVSFMEKSVLWHYRTAKGEEFEKALAELEGQKP